jgi:hypothetical protein
MSGQAKGTKRSRNDGSGWHLLFFSLDEHFASTGGRNRDRHHFLAVDEYVARASQSQSPGGWWAIGRKFVDESALLAWLIAKGLVRRVRTIQFEVRPLGGDSFKVTLEASKPTVGEAKVEIARLQGAPPLCQELYKVVKRADGLAVREDDVEPQPLDDESMALEDGDEVAMAVRVSSVISATLIGTGEMITDFLPFTCCVQGPAVGVGPN